MIPKDLEEFRELMERAHYYSGLYGDRSRTIEGQIQGDEDGDTFLALSTATPEQILGMVGEVHHVPDASRFVSAMPPCYVVTPRGEG